MTITPDDNNLGKPKLFFFFTFELSLNKSWKTFLCYFLLKCSVIWGGMIC